MRGLSADSAPGKTAGSRMRSGWPIARELWGRGCDRFGTAVLPRLVRPLPVLTHLSAARPVLSFDDGPHPDSTPRLLDALAAHQVRATFFVLGRAAARYPELVRRIAAAGHAVGCHGWTHRSLWRLRPPEQRAEFGRTTDLIESLTGAACDRVRPPFGLLTPTLLRWAAGRDAAVWMWRRMPPDYRADASEAIVAADLARARPGEIVCLHECRAARPRTARIVGEWLDGMTHEA